MVICSEQFATTIDEIDEVNVAVVGIANGAGAVGCGGAMPVGGNGDLVVEHDFICAYVDGGNAVWFLATGVCGVSAT